METQGVVLVVGSGGIGHEVAIALTRHGATALICADIDIESAQRVTEAARQNVIGTRPDFQTLALEVNVTNEESVQRMMDDVNEHHGRIDYFVNCSGFGAVGQTPVSSYSLAEYRKLDDMHHIGTFLLLRSVMTCMLGQVPRTIPLPRRQKSLSGRSECRGSIVIVASLASEGGYMGVAPYVAAKHAVAGLVQTCALENGRNGIRVNAVSPSYVAGVMMNKFLDESPELKASMLSDLPLGRLADPEEVADAVTFLCSGLSSYVNGHTLVLDGGASVALAKGAY